MMTTALNLGRPFRLPFEQDKFYFLEEDVRRLFPPSVAQWLIDHARKSDTAVALSGGGRTFRALPEAQDLPVLLGVRMSLSFPVLLSAIPFYTVRMRLVLSAVDQQMRNLRRAISRTGAPTWREVVEDIKPPSYPFADGAHRALAIRVLDALDAVGQDLESSGIDLATGAPRPEPEWRGTPRF